MRAEPKIVLNFIADSSATWFQTYKVDSGPILRFVDLFRKINVEQDATLAWASSCEHAQCGSCSVNVNGRPMLACELLVENAVTLFGGTEFKITPVSVAPVIRDLVVDWERAYERVHRAKPYLTKPKELPPGMTEHRISPQELARYEEATRCINCFCCAEACISGNRTFIGPNAAMASIVRMMDPREEEKNEPQNLLYSEEGIYRCHTSRPVSMSAQRRSMWHTLLRWPRRELFEGGTRDSDNSGLGITPNKAFLEMLGCQESEVIGKMVDSLFVYEKGTYESTTGELVRISEDFFIKNSSWMSQLFKNGNIFNWETYYLHKSRKIVPTTQNITLIYDSNGKISRLFCIIRDLTLQKKAEAELRISEARFRAIT